MSIVFISMSCFDSSLYSFLYDVHFMCSLCLPKTQCKPYHQFPPNSAYYRVSWNHSKVSNRRHLPNPSKWVLLQRQMPIPHIRHILQLSKCLSSRIADVYNKVKAIRFGFSAKAALFSCLIFWLWRRCSTKPNNPTTMKQQMAMYIHVIKDLK